MMKTLGQLSPKAAPVAVAAALVFFTGNLRAFGPRGAGNVGGANGAGTTGTTGGAVVGVGSRGGAAPGGNIAGSSGAQSGARGGVSISNSAPRLGASVRGNAPSGLSQLYRNGLNGPSPFVGTRPITPQGVTRPGNGWSGTAVGPNNADPTRSLYHSNGSTANRFTGQRLDPGANGANLPTTNGWTDRGRGNHPYRNGRPRFRVSGRYSYDPYAYGPAYAPYIGYYGGGYSSYAGAYPYYNEVPSNDIDNGPAAPVVTPQYVEPGQNPDNGNAQPDPARQQPAAPQNQNGNSTARGTIPGNGPDSLVEAVQEELVRRGYFGGKVDAMFGPDTKDALRKFQSDHHLADTGLINEATLHALQLD